MQAYRIKLLIKIALIIALTILPLYLVYSVLPEADGTFLWSFLVIPCFIIISAAPNWKVSAFVILSFVAFQIMTQYAFLHIIGESKVDTVKTLILSPLINLTILLTITYYRYTSIHAQNKLQELLNHDTLTGSYSRRYFEDSLKHFTLQAKETGNPLLLIMIDIDHFKHINDTYGHPYGDVVLKSISTMIDNTIRKTDIFARIGGEEFVILMPNASIEEGTKLAERIRSKVEETQFTYKDQKVNITVSLGLKEYQEETAEDFLEKVDDALYKAKHNGRNQYFVETSKEEMYV